MTMSYLTMRNGTIAGVCCLFFFAVQPVGATSDADFEKLYDYYFPKHGHGVTSSVYRKTFDQTLSVPSPGSEFRPRERQFYSAVHGDTSSLHTFLNNPDR